MVIVSLTEKLFWVDHYKTNSSLKLLDKYFFKDHLFMESNLDCVDKS